MASSHHITPENISSAETNHETSHLQGERITILFPLPGKLVTLESLHEHGIEAELMGLLPNCTYIVWLYTVDEDGDIALSFGDKLINSTMPWPFQVPYIGKAATPPSVGVKFTFGIHVFFNQGVHYLQMELRRVNGAEGHSLVHTQMFDFHIAHESHRPHWHGIMPEHRREAILIGWPPDGRDVHSKSLARSGLRAKLLGLQNSGYVLAVALGNKNLANVSLWTATGTMYINIPTGLLGDGEYEFSMHLYMERSDQNNSNKDCKNRSSLNPVDCRPQNSGFPHDTDRWILVSRSDKRVHVYEHESQSMQNLGVCTPPAALGHTEKRRKSNSFRNSRQSTQGKTVLDGEAESAGNKSDMTAGGPHAGGPHAPGYSQMDAQSTENSSAYEWIFDPTWCALSNATKATCTPKGFRLAGLSESALEPESVCKSLEEMGIRNILVHGDSQARHIKAALCIALTGDYSRGGMPANDTMLQRRCTGQRQFMEQMRLCKSISAGCCSGCGGAVKVCITASMP